jgi:hypothetical protein
VRDVPISRNRVSHVVGHLGILGAQWRISSTTTSLHPFLSFEAKMLRSEVMFPAQKTMPKLEHGRYTVANVRSGLALDLDAADDEMLMSWGFHGRDNQQARFFLLLSLRRS